MKTILLDMDGVLCNMVKSAIRLFGPEIGKPFITDKEIEEIIDRWPVKEYSLYNALKIEKGWFYKKISDYGKVFWSDLEPYPWTKELIKISKENSKEWYVCTSPMIQPSCSQGKVEWMHKNIRNGFHDYVITSHKHLLANNETLLIDDSDAKVEKFIENGGRAILFPQPWNKNHYFVNNRIEYVKEIFSFI